MSVRLSSRRTPRGTNAATLRACAFVFMTVGVIGRSILQNVFLGVNSLTGQEMLALLETDPAAMAILTAALLCKLVESCAAPLLAFLLVEGFLRTSSFEKYLIRIGVLALVTELPYNLAINGKLLHMGSRNPVFALFLGLVMLYFFNRYAGKGVKNIAVKVLVFVSAFLWCRMLNIEHGDCLVILVAVLWYVREKSNFRAVFAFGGAMLCTLFDMFYIGSCMSCIMLHRYNGERGEQNVVFNYAFYPALLLIVGVLGNFLV